MWNPHNDDFLITIPDFKYDNVLTKRHVLFLISQVFDPLGLIAAFTIRLNMFMQKIWSCKIDWDDQLYSELSDEWQGYSKGIDHLKQLKIPRSL